MIKTQIGLGVLSIPLVFDTLGMVPGVICLIVIAIITTWSDYVVGMFKLNHPEVYSIDDVGRMLAGSFGYWLLGGAFCLCEYSDCRQSLDTDKRPRLDLCRWLRHARHFHQFKCLVYSWDMHSSVCRSSCNYRL